MCTIMFIIAGFYWYHVCLRIYNRFKWHETGTAWEDTETISSKQKQQQQAATATALKQPLMNSHSIDDDDDDDDSDADRDKESKSWIQKFIRGFGRPEHVNVERASEQKKKYIQMMRTTSVVGYHEGYLSIRLINSSIWTRRYCVLSGHDLWLYRSKADYDRDPEKPVKSRPFRMDDYVMEEATDKSEPIIMLKSVSALTRTRAGAPEDEVQSILLKSDTAAELEGWMGTLFVVCSKLGVEAS